MFSIFFLSFLGCLLRPLLFTEHAESFEGTEIFIEPITLLSQRMRFEYYLFLAVVKSK